MNIKSIKLHNLIIKDAVREINECYLHTKNNYYGVRISEYDLNKDFGLIKSIKGIFTQKKYFIKGHNKLVSEYNMINTRKNLASIEIDNWKKEQNVKTIERLEKQETEFKELSNKVGKDEYFDECEKICKQMEVEKQNLNATKTKYETKSRTVDEPELSTTFLFTGQVILPMTHTTYKSKTETYQEAVQVPDEEKIKIAKENIEKLEKQLSELPNSEKNTKLYNMQKDMNRLHTELKQLYSTRKAISKKIKSINKDIQEYEASMQTLKELINSEKDLILSNYPKINKSLFSEIETELSSNGIKDKIRKDNIEKQEERLTKQKKDYWGKLYTEYEKYFTEKDLEK